MTGWTSLRTVQIRAQAEAAIRRNLDRVVDAALQCPSHEVTIATIAIGVRTLANETTLDDEQVSRLSAEALDRFHLREEART